MNDLERITSLHYMPSEGPYFLPSHLFPRTYVLTYPEMAFFSILLMGSFDLLSSNEHRNLIRYPTGVQLLGVDDVLRARLKTVGVSDHRFEMESAAGRDSGTEWRIIDVGGSRSQVSAVQLL